jgi:hypothetical protein
MQLVLSPTAAALHIWLDLEAAAALQLDITAATVAEALVTVRARAAVCPTAVPLWDRSTQRCKFAWCIKGTMFLRAADIGCPYAQAPKLKLTPRHIRFEPRASHMPTPSHEGISDPRTRLQSQSLAFEALLPAFRARCLGVAVNSSEREAGALLQSPGF